MWIYGKVLWTFFQFQFIFLFLAIFLDFFLSSTLWNALAIANRKPQIVCIIDRKKSFISTFVRRRTAQATFEEIKTTAAMGIDNNVSAHLLAIMNRTYSYVLLLFRSSLFWTCSANRHSLFIYLFPALVHIFVRICTHKRYINICTFNCQY